ncbi:MAG TPA: plastocyanin/azurin family copper-binding protein [Gemmatimonadales bacterium]|nr:plastocyanin/azurin family copper-binding protein [Gemmatimonadales bacterium]
MRHWPTYLLSILVPAAYIGCTNTPTELEASVVAINQNLAFTPDTLTVQVGSNVQWNNLSSDYHDLVSDSINSGSPAIPEIALAPIGGVDRQYRQTSVEVNFGTRGTYPYHCTIHPGMHGVLIVR